MRIKQRPVFSTATALSSGLLLLVALAGCGSGGSVAPTLSGELKGLAPGGVLILTVNGQSQQFSTSEYAKQPDLTFSRPFGVGESYTIDVVKHPVGQICAVLRGRAGRLDAAVSNVLVECHTTRLNDTGLYGSTPAQISALAPDSGSGRDAESQRLTKVGAGAFGFDYTKVCTSGAPVDQAGGCPTGETWDCVRDNVTELMWRRSDVPFTSGSTTPAASESLCGRRNWRAPTVHELLSVVHAGKDVKPFVDTDFFTATQPDTPFYTSEIYLDGSSGRWAVDFANGGAAGKQVAGDSRARWVSGSSALNDPPPSAYSRTEVNANYLIIDTSRELMWLVPKTLVQGDWSGAVAGVSSINAGALGGYSDWRLPNRGELDALANRNYAKPALDPKVKEAIADPTAASVVYWSSSAWTRDTARAWVVDLAYGDISPKLKTDSARLIYVRNRAFNAAP
ncbi:MAG: DUF1566 domain-containing protein [Betaproteobacteria bacterium]|jgi:hypothetical protein